MTDNKIEIRECENDFLKIKDSPYNDPIQIERAKTWYYNFTGKPYKDDVKDLIEIYKVICKNS